MKRASAAMPVNALRETLRDGFAELQLALPNETETAALEYLSLLQKWNVTYNLTAIREPKNMLVQHILDSAAIVPTLAEAFSNTTARVLDVGSGAGLPGLVLAMLNPAWSVTCCDAVAKKVAFIRQAISVLRLPNVDAIHQRVEDLEAGVFDLVVSRAFASLRDLCLLAGPSLKEGGKMIAMKGVMPIDEISELPEGWRVFRTDALTVPGLDAQRHLLWLDRVKLP